MNKVKKKHMMKSDKNKEKPCKSFGGGDRVSHLLPGMFSLLLCLTLAFCIFACPVEAEENAEEGQTSSAENLDEYIATDEQDPQIENEEDQNETQDQNGAETEIQDDTLPQSAGAAPRRVIRPDTTVRRTYRFHKDESGDELVDTQILKNNEYLTEPSIPEKNGFVFQGWSADGGNTFLSFGEENPVTDITETNEVDVYPVFKQSSTVTFHDKDGNVIKTQELTGDSSVNLADVTFDVSDGHYVSGWTTDQNQSETGKLKGTVTAETVSSNDTDHDGNLDLYPILKDVCWIFFDDSSEEDTTRSSYVAPTYIKVGEKITKPSDPSRSGYTFVGWSTQKKGGELFDFDTPVSESTVLYAQWSPEQVHYTVQVMMESLVNHKYVEGNYVVAGEYKVNGEKPKAAAGTVLNPDSAAGSGTDMPSEQDLTNWFDQNVTNGTYYDFDSIEQNVRVKGDGSTILHVYFKLHEFEVKAGLTWNVDNGTNIPLLTQTRYNYGAYNKKVLLNGYYGKNSIPMTAETVAAVADIFVDFNGTEYKVGGDDAFNFKARFGESLDGKIPDLKDIHIVKKEFQSGWNGGYQRRAWNNLSNRGAYGWYNGSTGKVSTSLSYLNADLIPEDYTRDSSKAVAIATFFNISYNHGTLHDMLENADNDAFTDHVKYDAFYSTARVYAGEITGFTHFSDEDTTVEANSAAPEGYEDKKTDASKGEYYYYYIRNRYELRIYNRDQLLAEYNSEDKTSDKAKIKWGASLKKYRIDESTLVRPTGLDENYQFLGWYTTEDCQNGTEFDFDQDVMPMENLTLYAKWGVPDVHVTYDLDGGSSDSISEDPVAVSYGGTVTQPANPVKEGYTFAGWGTEETGKPFNFATKLFSDVTLKARWTDQKTFRVIYDAGDGSGQPEDENSYENGTNAIVLGTPSAIPNGKYFYGWRYADGNLYVKGSSLQIKAEYAEKLADGKYQITLTAVYGDKAPGTTLVYNANGGTGDPYIISADNNAEVKLVSADDTGFSRNGYKFTNWNTKPDGSGDSYQAGDSVVVDRDNTDDAPNILYAQWKEASYTVTYTDGVDDTEIFKDDIHKDIPAGSDTPVFTGGTPTREGYTFEGWTPAVAEKVMADAVYTAQWKEDSKEEPDEPVKPTATYIVTYTDGVEDAEVFKDQVTSNIVSGTKTPAFEGTPSRDGYKFTGWTPTVAGTVTGNATYAATWEKVSKEESTTPVTPVSPDNPKTPETPATTDTTKDNTTPPTAAPNKDNGTPQNANAASASTKTANSPGTGDENHPMIYILGILGSAAVLAAVIAAIRRKRRLDGR